MARGTFIVFEGMDRTGKTTQTKGVTRALESSGLCLAPNLPWRFPDRSTAIGQTINNYLSGECTLSDQAVHLLFCANRWEKADEIERALQKGETVIVDRYAYSGVAYSMAKGMDQTWCREGDRGLPKPDVVVYLELAVDKARERGGWGEERYEKEEMQKKVGEAYTGMSGGNEWKVVDADGSEEQVFERVMDVVWDAVKRDKGDIGRLWE